MKPERLDVAFLALHPARSAQLVESHGDAARLMKAVRSGLAGAIGPEDVVARSEQRRRIAAAGCTVVFRDDGAYPQRLEEIIDPPDVLFVQGEIPDEPAVAVVGTRRCTGYGRRLAREFGRAIARAGWVLVSGLARGIDGEAHRGTIEGGGRGVAVLGCGSDIEYPREHRQLRGALLESGAVVTEYPPGARPFGWRFPPRNRIISGLAQAVVVVEAPVTGGALVTAARAMEQGRELFAVPGDVDREASVGCNLLIRDGAVPVLGPDDLVEALSLVLGPPVASSIEDSTVPSGGATLDQLGARLGLEGADLLAWVGRKLLDGSVRMEGDRVVPG